MAYSVGPSYRGLGYSALPTRGFVVETPITEDKIHKDSIEELDIRLKELNASIMDGDPQNIQKAYGALISQLTKDMNILILDETIEYLRKSTNLLGKRLLNPYYQKLILPYLLLYTSKNVKIIFDHSPTGKVPSRYDLIFLIRIKYVFEPYFVGENFDQWKEIAIDSIVEKAWEFDCPSIQLSELSNYVTHLTFLIHIFSQEDADYRPLTSSKSLLKEVSFVFLDRLCKSVIGYSFFKEVMSEKIGGKLKDTDVLIIGNYIKLDGFKLAEVSALLIQAQNKCEINSEGWNHILWCFLDKIEQQEKFLLLDVWYFAILFNDIKKEIGLEEGLDQKFLALFEKKIQIKLKDRTSFNCIGFGKSDVLNLVNDFRNIVVIWENLTTDLQRYNFVAVLLGIITIHLPALKCERACELLERVAPLLKTVNRSHQVDSLFLRQQVDSLLLRLVVELLSQGGVENSKGQAALIGRLMALSLFKNTDMYVLLKDWNYLYQDFMSLCTDDSYLVAAVSPILGISQRELVLCIYVQPKELNDIVEGEVFNIHKAVRRLVYSTIKKGGPSLLELNLIKRFAFASNKSIAEQIQFFKYLVCLFDLPLDLKKSILAKIFKTATPYERLKKDTLEWRNGIQVPKKVTVNEPQVNYLDYSAIFEFLNQAKIDFNPEELGIEMVHLIECFLLTPFSFQKTLFIAELDRKIGLKNEELMMKSLEEYLKFSFSATQHFKLDHDKIIPKICLHWISACDALYIAVRKKANYERDNDGEMKVKDLSQMSDQERAYFFVLKTAIQKMVVGCYPGILGGTLLDIEEAKRYIKSLNRPLFLKFLPGEPFMVFKGEQLKLRKIKQ